MPSLNDLAVQRVTLFFDPACPWTWRTSRWLVGAAHSRDIPVAYAALELAAGKTLDEIPESQREGARASRAFLRGVAAASERGEHDLIGDWYTAFGTARWRDGRTSTMDLVRDALQSAGGADLTDVLDDNQWDAAIARSRADAIAIAGDDVGTPVTVWDLGEVRRGFFGPVVAPEPRTGSDRLWDVVVNAARVAEFYELKTRRTQHPT